MGTQLVAPRVLLMSTGCGTLKECVLPALVITHQTAIKFALLEPISMMDLGPPANLVPLVPAMLALVPMDFQEIPFAL